MEHETKPKQEIQIDLKTYEQIFKQFLDIICFANPEGYFVQFNQQLPKITGHTPEELLRRPFLDFIHPDDRSKTKEELAKLRSGLASINFENRYICADGKIRWLEWTCIPVEDRDYLFAIARDVTVQRSSQEFFLETILDNIPDMIFVKEASDLRFVKFNKAGEDLLGYARSDLMGKNDYDFFPPSQADFFTKKDRSVFVSGQVLDIPEEQIQTRMKGKRILHTKKIPIYDEQGNPKYLIGISEDITEKKKINETQKKMVEEQIARQEAEKSLLARDEFLSIASHELKSPLSALKLQAQMFQRKIDQGSTDLIDSKKVEKLIDVTQKQVDRLTRLVNDMLDVSRIRTGRLTMDFSHFDLGDLISDVLERMRPEMLALSCGFPMFVRPNEKIFGQWDRLRIEQVLVNLLNNAIKYGLGSKIEVRLCLEAGKARFSVQDEGPGIQKEHLNKIFERFERAQERNEASGLGLGLYISEQIVKAHGGDIWAENRPSKGAIFVVELPLKK